MSKYMSLPLSISSRLEAMETEEDDSSANHRKKGEASNKENEHNDYRPSNDRKKRRSEYDNSKSRTREERETKRRPIEANARRIEGTPDSSKSESSLDHDTPQSSYKSASERITDEHIVTTSPSINRESFENSECASEDIIWPSWLGIAAAPAPPRELEDLLRRQRQRRQRREDSRVEDHPSIGDDRSSPMSRASSTMKLEDSAPDIDVSKMRSAKAVYAGDGWRLRKDWKKVPVISSKFRTTDHAVDPRSATYLKELNDRISRLVLDRAVL